MADKPSSTATFRGVPFRVDTEEYKGGRRAVVHVYPQRDKVFVEDLGRAPSRFTVSGFVGGKSVEEARKARDALLDALEKPGSATLSLPGWPSVAVAVDGDVTCSASANQRGRYNFSFTVVKDDGLTYPSLGVNTTRSVELASDKVDAAATADFGNRFAVDGYPDFVGAAAVADVSGAIDVMGRSAGRASSQVSDPLGLLRSQSRGMLSRPVTLAGRILSLYRRFVAFGARGQGNSGYSGMGGLGTLATYGPAPLAAPAATPSRLRQQDNRDALAALVRLAAVSQLARQAAITDWATRDDALQAWADIAALIDSESAATRSDAVFQSLSDLRIVVGKDIAARSADSGHLLTVTPLDLTTAASIAYDRWEDSSRETEVMGRNRAQTLHPLFVPSAPLTLASK